MCSVARKIIAVVGTERMCTYGNAYMYTVLPNVYLYYYICYYTTDVTTLVVSLTLPVVKMSVCMYMSANELSII